MIIISSIHIVVIGFLTLIFLKPNLLINKFKVKPLNFKIDSRYILIFFVLISLVITFVIYCKDYLVYKELYSFNILFVSSLFLISSILISIPIVLKRPKLAIFGIIVGSTLISLVPIIFFPITSKIGDLMPILYKQAEALMNNQNIYQYYLLDNGVLTQAVRQPGTVIAYLPAYIFQFDLRIMSILYTVLTAFIFIKISYKKIREIKFNKKWVLFFLGLGIFLLSPY